jgi:hypothetical protein
MIFTGRTDAPRKTGMKTSTRGQEANHQDQDHHQVMAKMGLTTQDAQKLLKHGCQLTKIEANMHYSTSMTCLNGIEEQIYVTKIYQITK